MDLSSVTIFVKRLVVCVLEVCVKHRILGVYIMANIIDNELRNTADGDLIFQSLWRLIV